MAVIMAVAMIPLLLAAGGAIDFARLYLAKTRLIYAVDSAALAVGASDQSMSQSQLEAVFDSHFNANFPSSKLGTPAIVNRTITAGSGGGVTVTATVTVNTIFLKLASINTLTAEVSAQVRRSSTTLELALVLDNTNSMVASGLLAPLKTSVTEMLDILFHGNTTSTDVKVAIVPYVAAVNIGSGNTGFVQFPASPANEYPVDDGLFPSDPIVDTAWKGCVEARDGGNDVLDSYDGSTGNAGKWKPYFWESEHYYRTTSGTPSACVNRWWRRNDYTVLPPLPRQSGRAGDPSFYDDNFYGVDHSGVIYGTLADNGLGSFRSASNNALTNTSPSSSVGPNRACPTAVTPLTNDRSTLDPAVTAMQGWAGSGTIINTGVVWGWRALSPDPPFDQGVAYGTANNQKVMVIMTDGDNLVPSQSILCRSSAFNGNPRYNSDYTAYGYASEGRLDGETDPALVDDILDSRLATLCQNIKDAGIIIYTITLGSLAPTTVAQMTACATSSSHYFNAPDATALQNAFQAIAGQLINLRVAQ